MGEAAAALIASVQLLSPSLLPPFPSHLLKELRENFNSGVTRLAVPTYIRTTLHVIVKTRSMRLTRNVTTRSWMSSCCTSERKCPP
jgi:hypothetical protein